MSIKGTYHGECCCEETKGFYDMLVDCVANAFDVFSNVLPNMVNEILYLFSQNISNKLTST